MGWVLLTLGSDFRRWFHNFFYAPWTEWLVSMVWSPIEAWGKLPVHVRARVLDMGVTPASNICQWIAQYFIDQWYMLMDEYTKNMTFRKEPKFMAWETARKKLSAQTGMNQHRPNAAWVYGDDPKFHLPGVDIAMAGIAAWEAVTSRYHIQMSKPHKWYCGAWSKWCGLLHIDALGVIAMSAGKRIIINAEAKMQALEGPRDARKYHSHIARIRYYLIC
jgi:hypothetical protein